MKKTLLILFLFFFSVSLKAQEKSTVDTVKKNNLVFTSVQVQPEFPGDQAAFGEFLAANIKYPEADKKKNIQGRVYVQFVVERDGSLSDIKVLRAPSQTLADETIRVLQLSPDWKPGIQDNRPVRVQFTVPVNFSIPSK